MLSACGCMGISLNLSRANVGALNVLLGALVSFPVTVPLCVFFWTCHLQPSRPTLPPSHSSPNSDLMLTSCWPLTRILIFLRLVVLFFVCSWKPTFLSVHSVTNTLHTDYVLSTSWDGGSVPHSLTLSVCAHHLILFPTFSLIAFIFSFFSRCPFALLPPFLSLNVCMCMRLTSIAYPSRSCMKTLGWGAVTLAG